MKVIFNLEIFVLAGEYNIPQKQELVDFARRHFLGKRHVSEGGFIFKDFSQKLSDLQKLRMTLRVDDNLVALKNHIDFYNLSPGISYGDSRPYIILERGMPGKERFYDIELSFDNFQKRWRFNMPSALYCC